MGEGRTAGQAIGASEPLAIDVVRPDARGPAAASGGAGTTSLPSLERWRLDREAAARGLPRGDLGPFQRWFRHLFSRTVAALIVKGWFRVSVVHRERILDRPCVYAFNHLSWMDPLLLLATFPAQPRLYFYGPKQVDLRQGGRNRFMWWTGIPIPFSPGKQDLRLSIRRSEAVFGSGGALAIAPEGSIHVHEGDLLPFEEGAAYLAIRSGVPIVPVAITGISQGLFRGRVLIRVGEAIETAGVHPTRQNVTRFSALTWHAIRAMVAGDRDLPRPGRVGRWLTDLFNDWGPGGREAASQRRGPDPSEVPIPPLETR